MAERAMRLVFRHDSTGVSLKSAQRLDMRVPPPDIPEDELGRPTVGLFAELRSGDGRALFSRVLASEEARRLEYPTGDPDREFGHAESSEPVFVSVVVPAERDAKSVALVRAEPPRRFPLSLLSRRPRRRDVSVFNLPQGEE